MAPNFEGGKNTIEQSKEETGQEKRDKTGAEKIKDFEQLSPEEKLNEIDGVMLDSENLLKGVKSMEIEALGGQDAVKEGAGWFGKIKIKFADTFGSDERRFESIAKVAHKATDRDIDNISKNIGQELLAREADLTKHKSNADNDLKILQDLGLHSQDQLKDISGKLEAERESNRQMVENLKLELADRTAGYRESAIEKSRELLGFFDEYKGVYDNLRQEKRQLAGKVSKFEQALKSFKVEGDMDYKSEVEEELLKLKNDLGNIEQAEAKLKTRLDLVGTNKREVDTFLDRIDKIGSTDKEFRQKKLERKRVIESGSKNIDKSKEAEQKRAPAEAGQKVERRIEAEAKAKSKEDEPVVAGDKLPETEDVSPQSDVIGFGRVDETEKDKAMTEKKEEQTTVESAQVVKENKLPETVNEWIALFSKEFGPLYDRPSKKNPKPIAKALEDKFTENSQRLSGNEIINEKAAKKYAVNFLKKMTSEYKRDPEKARKKVEEVIKKIKESY